MRRVGSEFYNLLYGAIQSFEDLIPGLRHTLQLVTSLWDCESPGQVLYRNRLRSACDVVDRRQGATAHPIAANSRESEDCGNRYKHQVPEIANDLLYVFKGGRSC